MAAISAFTETSGEKAKRRDPPHCLLRVHPLVAMQVLSAVMPTAVRILHSCPA
jgi:hypothetical protein